MQWSCSKPSKSVSLNTELFMAAAAQCDREHLCVFFCGVFNSWSDVSKQNTVRELILRKQGWSKWLPMGKSVGVSISSHKGYGGEFLSIVSYCFCVFALGWTVCQPFGFWNERFRGKVMYVSTDPNNCNVKRADVWILLRIATLFSHLINYSVVDINKAAYYWCLFCFLKYEK